MASHREFVVEWTMLDANYNNWTVDDLQLAAELGRTLLERNEELENELKAQQVTIEDQGHEIVFLTKQITSMKEESSSRSKVYEQLESSLSDLERNNAELSRKHELDKKRMQSMCENIDYLERKCEELSGTLESIRDSNKKHYNGKINQSGYFHFGSSDSSEDDSGCGFGFRRRSQSLQDFRDYTPSPDDLDSNHSNSPDLKTSEAEFMGTLEARVEELIGAKKKEVEQITQLENQLRILVQENTNLQQKLIQVTSDKDDQIEELRFQLLDQTAALFPRTPSRYNNQSIFPTPIMSPESTISNSDNSSNLTSPRKPNFGLLPKPMCKRCSTEINFLHLVNSIEVDSEDYSSLEFELARAEEALHLNSIGRSERTNPEDLFGRYMERKESDDENKPEEDPCLVKDFGPELYTKNCDDFSDFASGKKLRLPSKIPAADMYSEYCKNNQDPDDTDSPIGGNLALDHQSSLADPIVSVKKRSKLWWLAWFVLLVLGIVEFIGAICSFTFFLIIAAILPKSSPSTSIAASSSKFKLLPFRQSCKKVN